jgi:hypothetical protein
MMREWPSSRIISLRASEAGRREARAASVLRAGLLGAAAAKLPNGHSSRTGGSQAPERPQLPNGACPPPQARPRHHVPALRLLCC